MELTWDRDPLQWQVILDFKIDLKTQNHILPQERGKNDLSKHVEDLLLFWCDKTTLTLNVQVSKSL